MANLLKLKEKARALELTSQWRPALEVYQRMADEDGEEIGVWNRIGDLHLRLGEADRAVEAYERGMDAYAEAGLLNNAIALCKKILRTAPERTIVYRRLAQFTAAQGFLADARAHFLTFAERMRKLGHHDEALDALREAVRHLPEDLELRRTLAEQLHAAGHTAEAVDQLGGLRAPPAPPAAEPEPHADVPRGELEIERSSAFAAYDLPDPGSIEGLERVQQEDDDIAGDDVPPLPLMDLQLASLQPREEAAEGPDLAHHLNGEASAARAHVVHDRVIELEPGNEEARRAGTHPPLPSQPGRGESHFEHGRALEEKGMLDEAIAELQAALREGSRLVPTLEALGECFHAQGHFSLAARVLERALHESDAAEEEQIGVHYWIARSREALGDTRIAREHYERVLAYDILHRDARARFAALLDGGESAAP